MEVFNLPRDEEYSCCHQNCQGDDVKSFDLTMKVLG